MSKNLPILNYDYGYVIGGELPNYLIGRILTIVDSLGLRETQEKAVKDLIKGEVWNSLQNNIYLTPEDHSEIHKRYEEYIKERNSHSSTTVNSPIAIEPFLFKKS